MEQIENELNINKIELHNFLSYPDCIIELKQGTIICGIKNGAGKTSIAESILYCLTGKSIRNNLFHKHTDEMYVKLFGIINKNDSIIIHRGFNKRQFINVYLNNSSESISDPKTFLSKYVDSKLFTTLIYIDGHNLTELINENDEGRSKILDNLFGIETMYRVSHDIIKLNQYNSLINSITNDINSKTDIYNNTQNVISTSSQLIYDTQLNEIDIEIIKITDIISQLKQKLLSYEQQKLDYCQHKTQYLNLMSEIETLELKMLQKEKNELYLRGIKEYQLNGESISETISRYKKLINIEQQNSNERNKYYSALSVVYKYVLSHSIKLCPLCNNTFLTYIKPKSNYDSNLDVYQEQLNDVLEYSKAIIPLNFNKIQTEIDLKNKQLDEIIIPNFNENQYLELKSSLMSNESHLINLNTQKKMLLQKITQLKNIDHSNVYLQSIQNEIETLNEKLNNTNKHKQHLNNLQNGFNLVLESMRQLILNNLNPTIQSWLDVIVNQSSQDQMIEFIIELKQKTVREREKPIYIFKSKLSNEEIPFDDLSTGQKAICIISLLLSLSELYHPYLNLMIFDEIQTSGIDDDSNLILMQAISSIANRINILFIDRNELVCNTLFQSFQSNNIDTNMYYVNRKNLISELNKIN